MPTTIKDLHIKGYERVVKVINDKAKLDAVIAIHNIRLGPALGGCRFLNYANAKMQLDDALRLAESMTYKNSICGINNGGGKAVINAKATNGIKTPELYQALGEALELLDGMYYSAGDVGTSIDDLLQVKLMTNYCGGIKDSSGPTATGVYNAMKAAVKFTKADDSLDNMHIAISGTGKVGGKLAKLLAGDNASLTLADINQQTLNKLQKDINFQKASDTDIHKTNCDIFSPCALGNAINADTKKQLNCNIIAGGANNQLDNSKTADWLFANNIVYCPDYLVNSGGVIAISAELNNTLDGIDNSLQQIGTRTMEVLVMSKAENISSDKISKKLALQRINNA